VTLAVSIGVLCTESKFCLGKKFSAAIFLKLIKGGLYLTCTQTKTFSERYSSVRSNRNVDYDYFISDVIIVAMFYFLLMSFFPWLG
jgi:hypothetical protein